MSNEIAAVSWQGGHHIRVFHQQDDLKVYEFGWDPARNVWYKGNGGDPVFSARRDTPLVAFFVDEKPYSKVHIYYIGTDNVIKQYINKTYPGDSDPDPAPPPSDVYNVSSLAAVALGAPSELNVPCIANLPTVISRSFCFTKINGTRTHFS
ncbi:hypothetical protein BJ138DRAFT_479203 [Hygrophoropsis aurantiaca]|uniref:Uncharacterized protein n=1 Tax=Hygrophoropsis aurantiaca TaxID=72124 RepID=A0ACB8AL92_9AGAM|nr:hypothetical protein BJ138DRAFT_479203 [Hygrophoropsis aurantiaca]